MPLYQELTKAIKNYTSGFHAVVPFESAKDKLLKLDFTESNKELSEDILNDTQRFSDYINRKLNTAGALYGIGGYDEHRTIYSRSHVFGPQTFSNSKDSSMNRTGARISPLSGQLSKARIDNGVGKGAEPRRLHLGIDIWGDAGTPVYAPLEGVMHSLAFNDAYGDYGATLILQHELEGIIFHSLYGHLSLHSIEDKKEGQVVEKGERIAAFGEPAENGHWPPHLHFQLIINMEGMKGDYPGVCKYSEREKYLANCPDADFILNMLMHVKG